jgi:hypothetical protein
MSAQYAYTYLMRTEGLEVLETVPEHVARWRGLGLTTTPEGRSNRLPDHVSRRRKQPSRRGRGERPVYPTRIGGGLLAQGVGCLNRVQRPLMV